MVDRWALEYFALCTCGHEKELAIRAEFKSGDRVSEVEMRDDDTLGHVDEESEAILVDCEQGVAIRGQDHPRDVAPILKRECRRYIGCQIE